MPPVRDAKICCGMAWGWEKHGELPHPARDGVNAEVIDAGGQLTIRKTTHPSDPDRANGGRRRGTKYWCGVQSMRTNGFHRNSRVRQVHVDGYRMVETAGKV